MGKIKGGQKRLGPIRETLLRDSGVAIGIVNLKEERKHAAWSILLDHRILFPEEIGSQKISADQNAS